MKKEHNRKSKLNQLHKQHQRFQISMKEARKIPQKFEKIQKLLSIKVDKKLRPKTHNIRRNVQFEDAEEIETQNHAMKKLSQMFDGNTQWEQISNLKRNKRKKSRRTLSKISIRSSNYSIPSQAPRENQEISDIFSRKSLLLKKKTLKQNLFSKNSKAINQLNQRVNNFTKMKMGQRQCQHLEKSLSKKNHQLQEIVTQSKKLKSQGMDIMEKASLNYGVKFKFFFPRESKQECFYPFKDQKQVVHSEKKIKSEQTFVDPENTSVPQKYLQKLKTKGSEYRIVKTKKQKIKYIRV